MIEVGQEAPDFSAESSEGSVHLKSLRGSPVVLYFYPAADTPGCTIESKAFQERLSKFQAKKVRILGISTDTVPAQKAFAEHCSLRFPLVADVSKKITESFGVLKPSGSARRVTFLIDAEGKVAEVIDTGSPMPHVEAAERRYLTA
jgi:thioredoxin-dependent peroxiredoxin